MGELTYFLGLQIKQTNIHRSNQIFLRATQKDQHERYETNFDTNGIKDYQMIKMVVA
jgi:hypothetical protein